MARKYVVIRRYLLEEYWEVDAENKMDAIEQLKCHNAELQGSDLEESNCFDYSVHQRNKDGSKGRVLLEIDEHALEGEQ